MSLQRLVSVFREIDVIERDGIDWRAEGGGPPWVGPEDIRPSASQVKLFAYSELDLKAVGGPREIAIDCYRRVADRVVAERRPSFPEL